MQKSEFYYGLPQSQWDILLTEAENLLRDREIGTHLVGLYPAGNRIYGIESESPGIMCLYIDTVESLINPTFKSGNPTGFITLYHSNARKPILFVNLFDWITRILRGNCGGQNRKWIHALPFSSDIIYQDNSIDIILELTRNYLINRKFSMLIGNWDGYDQKEDFLFHRTDAILANTNKFYPCINPEWAKVSTLDSLPYLPKFVKKIDNQMKNYLLGRDNLPDNQKLYETIHWLKASAQDARESILIDSDLTQQIGQEIADLYRSLV